MSAPCKHREISETLRREIAEKRFSAGDRLPSEMQLVRRFGVSRPTVVRALEELEREGLIVRRAGSGSYLREREAVPNARRLFGMLLPGIDTLEIFEPVAGEIACLARAQECGVLWGGGTLGRDFGSILASAGQLCEQLIAAEVRGVFFAPLELTDRMDEVNQHLLDRLRSAGIPVVLLDRDILPFPHRSELDLVGIDNVAGGFLLAEHLIKLGCQRLTFVARRLSAPTIEARITGCLQAMMQHRISPSPDWVQRGDPEDSKFVRSMVTPAPPDAFVCASDYTAALLLRSLERLNIRVPKQVRVVGFDDVKYATLLSVPLTTIHQPCRSIALAAFRAMIERLNDPSLPPRSLLLPPQLVVRESCGAYSREAASVGRQR